MMHWMHHNTKFELQKSRNWHTHTRQTNLFDAQIYLQDGYLGAKMLLFVKEQKIFGKSKGSKK